MTQVASTTTGHGFRTEPALREPPLGGARGAPKSKLSVHSEVRFERFMVFYLLGAVLAATGWIYSLATGTTQNPNLAGLIPTALGALILAVPMFIAAIKELRDLRPSASTLAALAILAALASGMFVEAAVIAFVLQVADLFVRRTASGAIHAIEQLVGLTPDTARLVDADGQEREASVGELRLGQIVRVRPGENLPVDGRIIRGRTTVNQASLTGESMPIEADVGREVYAGTTNLTGQIDIEVTHVGEDTTIGKVTQLIREAEHDRNPRQILIEQVSRFYVPIAVAVAFAVFFFTAQSGDRAAMDQAALRAITVLVVMCPTSLLLASPTAMVAAFAAAARLGIMVKDSRYMDAAASVDAVVLDKTGTMTTGSFGVSRLAPVEGVEPAELLRAAVNGEQHSNHPLAQSILATGRQARITPDGTDEVEEIHGRGVRARTSMGEVCVGRSTWLVELNPAIEPEVQAVEKRIEGMSGVHVMLDGRYLGAVGLEDKVRAQAKSTVDRLREMGMRMIAIFTGDRMGVALRVGKTVGVDAIEAECLPEEKHEQVRRLREEGYRVLMVGDGINDGPALAEADVGVAMGLSGSDIAANSAGVALMTDELNRLPFLVQLARRTRLIIAQNLTISLGMATIGLILAASGQFAAFASFGVIAAMLFNFGPDLCVIGNSFRLFRFGEDFLNAEHEAREAARHAQRRGASARGLQAAG